MKYLSLCSGIEAASIAWHPLGWSPVAFSEIDPFPSAVLQHRFPDVPNWGDMNEFQTWPQVDVDLVVGGTPCQSYSIAGLRQGLKDPRGNLTLTFLAVLDKYKPQWVVWENVPGILSDKTNALGQFLDGLEELGYVIDIDIIDAQFCGLAQRRRRVFVCGQHRDFILKKTTISSGLTIAQCLIEISHGLFQEALAELKSADGESIASVLTAKRERSNGIARKTRLFSLESLSGLQIALNHLAYLSQQSCVDLDFSASDGNKGPTPTEANTKSLDTKTGKQFGSTGSLPPNLLDDLCSILNLSTTSISSSPTIHQTIFMCSEVGLSIAKLITASNSSSPAFWSAASSALTALKEFTNYARRTVSDLFGDVGRVQAWCDFIRQAEQTSKSLGDINVRDFGEILPLSESLSRDSPPRREAGERVAGTLKGGSGERGYPDPSDGNGGGLVDVCSDVSPGVTSGDPFSRTGNERIEAEALVYGIDSEMNASEGLMGTLRSHQSGGYEGATVAHTLSADGFDASGDGTGRGTPIIAETFRQTAFGEYADDGTASTMKQRDHKDATDLIVAIQERSICENPDAGPDGIGVRTDGAAYTLEAQTVPQAVAIRTAQTSANGHDIAEDVAHTLDSAQGQAVAFSCKDSGQDAQAGVSPTLRSMNDSDSHANGGGQVAVAFHPTQDPVSTEEYSHAMSSGCKNGQASVAVMHQMAVRRLLPVECEKLQGFEPDWTLVPVKKVKRARLNSPSQYKYIEIDGEVWQLAADGPRYKAIGNSMACNVMEWIGRRIADVDAANNV